MRRLFLFFTLAVFVSDCKDEDIIGPKAAFTVDPTAVVKDTVHFINNSTNAGHFVWDFGDGSGSEETNPIHVYIDNGIYSVRLKAINGDKSDETSQAINIIPPVWRKTVIDNDVATAVSVDMADIDGDGDEDILVPSFAQNDIIIYKNNFPDWEKEIINSDAIGVTFAYFGDMDGNGSMDIVANHHLDHQMILYLNNSSGWTAKTIDPYSGTADMFQIADINGNGKLDIVTVPTLGGPVVWYENQYPDWIKHVVEEGLEWYATPSICDLDADGSLDIVVTLYKVNKILWFRNVNNGQEWTRNIIDDNLLSAWGIIDGDIDNDGDIDFMVTTGGPYEEGKTVSWYENDDPNWTPHEIDNNLNKANIPGVEDLNGDGMLDVIVTGFGEDAIVWYENRLPNWKKFSIGNIERPRFFYLKDLNKDGHKDIIVAGINEVAWFENPGRL